MNERITEVPPEEVINELCREWYISSQMLRVVPVDSDVYEHHLGQLLHIQRLFEEWQSGVDKNEVKEVE